MEEFQAYVAGVFDGEGTVTLTRQRKTEFRSPVVSISNTYLELLSPVKQVYGGTICSKRAYKLHHTPSYAWSVHRNRALDFLQDILPYMRHPTKRYRAQLLLDNYKRLTPRNGRYTNAMIEAKRQFEHDFFHPSTS